ncbi:DUF1990 family protein [Roseisolibacter agri]|uniref:DUF1990 domain-containing protein n=1 Tax=Roseisolibacter agri TaxID=2014610 RepID=A0AA37VB02_9BACT|nr:DUF1990 domain-containing protein [Roseisolibacter agri]GLC25948.1 DUF1990 domain-containing protein [Roseisolibacter agri]
MFRLTRPDARAIAAFLAGQRDAAFTYDAVGATREGGAPAGYTVDHNRVRLGTGRATFERARDALHAWRMLRLGWASIQPADAPIAPGTTVAVVVRHYGFWSLNACRIVHAFDDEADGVRRAGFAYGTLPAHGAVGEERFTVEWHRADDAVWYDLYAFSRPRHLLARLGRPFARALQRRFARASKQAMVDAAAR